MVPPIDSAWSSTSSTQPQLPLWMPRPRAPEGEICSWRSGDSSRGRGLYEQTGCNWIVGLIWQYVYSIMQLCTGRGLQDQFHVPFLNISSLLGESMANKRCSSKIIQAKNIGTILLYIYILCFFCSVSYCFLSAILYLPPAAASFSTHKAVTLRFTSWDCSSQALWLGQSGTVTPLFHEYPPTAENQHQSFDNIHYFTSYICVYIYIYVRLWIWPCSQTVQNHIFLVSWSFKIDPWGWKGQSDIVTPFEFGTLSNKPRVCWSVIPKLEQFHTQPWPTDTNHISDHFSVGSSCPHLSTTKLG